MSRISSTKSKSAIGQVDDSGNTTGYSSSETKVENFEKIVSKANIEYVLMIGLSFAPRFSSSFQTGVLEVILLLIEFVVLLLPCQRQKSTLRFFNLRLKLCVLIFLNFLSLYFVFRSFNFDYLPLTYIERHSRPTQKFMFLSFAIVARAAILIKTSGALVKLLVLVDNAPKEDRDRDPPSSIPADSNLGIPNPENPGSLKTTRDEIFQNPSHSIGEEHKPTTTNEPVTEIESQSQNDTQLHGSSRQANLCVINSPLYF